MLTGRELIRKATTRTPSLRARKKTLQSHSISGKFSTNRIKLSRSRIAQDVRRIGRIVRQSANTDRFCL
jgi:hypothetical protein